MNNNMNNLGMNPIGINPMLMNNMGMNIQPNLMDNTALNIKNIIKPYEDKIRQLEEIIKQKDFEIIVLKQKLNKNNLNNNLMNMNQMMGMNMNPMMGMNMNPMMEMNMSPMMEMNMSPILPRAYSSDNEITINIESRIKNFRCNKNDKPSFIQDNLFLVYNYNPIDFNRTLEENGILNGSIINITDSIYNITFKDFKGIKIVISLDGYCPINQAIKLYCKKIKDQSIYQQVLNNKICFLYNAFKFDALSTNPIKDIFRLIYNPLVMVVDTQNIP